MLHADLSAELDAARSAFDRACTASGPPATVTVQLAGRAVRISVARRTLFDGLFPALSHLETAPSSGEAALNVRVWDAADSSVPGPNWHSDDPGVNGTVDTAADGSALRYRRRTSTTWFDRQRPELLACFPSAESLSLNDRSKPLQFPLSVWHLDVGIPMVHAGVVAREGRGVLFPGKGGSGKSTASLSCALAGYDYVGDDCVAIERRADGSVGAHSVFGSTNLAPHHLIHFPALAPYAIAGTTPDEDKHLVLLKMLLPRPIACTAIITAIVIPRVASVAATRLVPASRAEALRALAPSTLLFFPGWGTGQLEFLADVVSRVPCYLLEMSPRLDEIPTCVDALTGGS